MALTQQIMDAVREAQKGGDTVKVAALRMLVAAIKNREIEKRGTGAAEQLTEEEATQVLQKEAKKRKEAAELYMQGGRADLARKEEVELKYIYDFIPAPLDREAVEAEVEAIIKASVAKDFNTIMKETMAKLKGRADGKTVGEVIKSKLSS